MSFITLWHRLNGHQLYLIEFGVIIFYLILISINVGQFYFKSKPWRAGQFLILLFSCICWFHLAQLSRQREKICLFTCGSKVILLIEFPFWSFQTQKMKVSIKFTKENFLSNSNKLNLKEIRNFWTCLF